MYYIKTNPVQQIVNKANCFTNFTYYLNNNDVNYIVSICSIYEGNNPSLFYDLNLKVREIINSKVFDSIGGWYNEETNIYYLDANIHFMTLSQAIETALKYNQVAIYDVKQSKVLYTENLKEWYNSLNNLKNRLTTKK